ncbi:MAG: protein translocase subunit SecF [Methylobacterium sp.]|jgi:preprotein translocase subunit SecF|uniref:protein translocase subunit SecF n=1 Tax=Rhabdaerophilum sp. TaxID=2717341 RepID=UPI0022CCED5F|nr:protein translocase subunit SecF [Methylobacterium sp.]MCE2932565.1 protein translocase subunit SecF [Hyphomicrobiales bacterium]MCZ8271139.1 protein translocase subunit SecF [Beijerinckiaceae bacterium]MCA3652691.1 protein translocase subunit SecF [Methylobacterium sp.]MCA3658343.1 protein translocase subunit SecF [Methylobacterium sp.]
MKLLRIVPDNTKFGFMRFRRFSFPFSAIASIVSVVAFLWLGLNVGIDFKGGTVVELQARGDRANVALIREEANRLGFGDVEVQEFGGPREVLLRVGLQDGGDRAQAEVVVKLRQAFEKDYDFRKVEVVGPRVSQELVQNGTIGVLLAILTILIYLWFRYEWQFAVGAVIATMHDLVLTIGFFAVTQIQFDQTSIAAILTIIGYSLNDTVVVYDRVRELLRKYKKIKLFELLDLSMNSTLPRTVITSVTTILALIALSIFGGDAIWGFCIALLFGVLIGTYSSIFVAAPILIYLGVRVGEGVGSEKPADKTTPAPAR